MESESRIYTKLDKLDETLAELSITSAKQEINIREHMRRSDALEKRQDVLEGKVQPVLERINTLGWLLSSVSVATIGTIIIFLLKLNP